METDEGDFEIVGNSPEDEPFDEVIGLIEDFMINFDAMEVMRALPPPTSATTDHEKHAIYQTFVEQVGKKLDEYVATNSTTIKDLAVLAKLLETRHEEISDEVIDFINEGFFEYTSFVEQWSSCHKTKKPSESSTKE